MIFTIPFYLFYAFLLGLISVIPTASPLPVYISSGFNYVFGFMGGFDFILPISQLPLALVIGLGYSLVVFTWAGVHWVLRKIPFLHIH